MLEFCLQEEEQSKVERSAAKKFALNSRTDSRTTLLRTGISHGYVRVRLPNPVEGSRALEWAECFLFSTTYCQVRKSATGRL